MFFDANLRMLCLLELGDNVLNVQKLCFVLIRFCASFVPNGHTSVQRFTSRFAEVDSAPAIMCQLRAQYSTMPMQHLHSGY